MTVEDCRFRQQVELRRRTIGSKCFQLLPVFWNIEGIRAGTIRNGLPE